MKRKFTVTFLSLILLMASVDGANSINKTQAVGNQAPRVSVATIFCDNMVLQQKEKTPVWGKASDGETVTVRFMGQEKSAISEDGKWKVELDPVDAGGPYEMGIESGKDRISINNILVGEVWVCSGQSNMALNLKSMNGYNAEIAKDNFPNIRQFVVAEKQADEPAEDISKGSWNLCTANTAGNFTAVGYYFARELANSLNVPVGIIKSSVGATPIQAWIGKKVFDDNPDLLVDPLNKVNYKNDATSALYNAMIAPLQPFAIRGVVWYQGEANGSRYDPVKYRELLPAMIKGWREDWGQGDFPFLFVQLPGFKAPGGQINNSWAYLRESQLATLLSVPNTGMAVSVDIDDREELHPKIKEPIGIRLSLAARAIAYGEDIEYSGPIYKSMEVQDNKIILTFDHAGRGLLAGRGELNNFRICGEDNSFVAAKAEIVDKDKIAVWSDDIANPVAVRYGWSNSPDVDLFNEEGIPASPFRTDNF